MAPVEQRRTPFGGRLGRRQGDVEQADGALEVGDLHVDLGLRDRQRRIARLALQRVVQGAQRRGPVAAPARPGIVLDSTTCQSPGRTLPISAMSFWLSASRPSRLSWNARMLR